jgi:adenosylcobinamide kinase / adenosylcobinamide-phosphate guanylyltransferase
MPLALLLGGVRSGKSALAIRRASAYPGRVTFIATAEAGDAEMAARIERHRGERSAAWETVEEPLELAGAIVDADPEAFVIVDCLSFWVANLLERGDGDAEVEQRAADAAARAAAREPPTVVVSNEVGMGVVPASAAGRAYRDLLGRTNTIWAERAAQVELIVAGRVLRLEASDGQ